MSLADLSANVKIETNWYATRSNGDVFAESVFGDVYQAIQSFLYGTGSEQINQLYVAERTVTLATPTDDIDLSGTLENAFGDTISFSAIKAAFIYNLSENSADKLKVGGKSGNGWSSPFGASTGFYNYAYASGVWQITAPLGGYAVVASSSDILRIQHAGSVGDITYILILLGVE